MKTPISVYPQPKTPVASNMTTFSFRGIKKKNLGPVVVFGKKTGRHRGSLLAHSDGKGVSFVPKGKFARGEFVWVRTKRWIRGAMGGQNGRFWVKIGNFYGSDEVGKPAPAPPVTGTMKTRPVFAPPVLDVKTSPTAGAAEGMLFLAPKNAGMTITDRQGRIVWFRPVGYGGTGDAIYDFRMQRYRGKPVLTYWKGASSVVGYSQVGHFEILNRNYTRIARFKPGNGYEPDIHEFRLTPRNTAMVLSYRGVLWNASKFGGSKNTRVLDNVVQEIDVKTGAVLFEWHSLGQVSVGSSLRGIKNALTPPADDPKKKMSYDYFHVNSAMADGKDAVLISARNTSSLYRINVKTGKIMWALRGWGKKARSDFKMEAGSRFSFQHDAERLPNGNISLFDNGLSGRVGDSSSDQSSGLVLRLSGSSKANRTAKLVLRNSYPGIAGNPNWSPAVPEGDPMIPGIASSSQGNAEPLPTGGMLVGWGSTPQLTEFDKNGQVVFDMAFPPGGAHTYRAYKAPWNGIARERPAIASEVAAQGDPEGMTVWASWNGSSNIAEWRVLAGPDEAGLTEVKTEPWANLETEIGLPGTVPAKVRVEALDKSGKVIGKSAIVTPGKRSR